VCWGIYTSLCYKFPAESNGERILKIGKYLVKLLARVRCLVFLTHSVVSLPIIIIIIIKKVKVAHTRADL